MTSVASPKTASHEVPEPETLDEILMEEEVTAKAGCGILGRYPLISVISFAALGLGIGIVSLLLALRAKPQDESLTSLLL